jgi:hypothetical protein
MAAHANPDYDQHWRFRHAEAEEALALAEEARMRATAVDFGGLAYREAVERAVQARIARTEAWAAQFPTIADYAAWRFSSLPQDGFAVVQDFAGFASRGEVDAAFARARRDTEEGTDASRHQLRTGQPPGMVAFAGAVTSTRRRFGEIDLVVSFSEALPYYHVCLAHRWGELAGSNEIFRAAASQLMRESIVLLLPEAEAILNDGRHRLLEHRDVLRQVNALVARFVFYRHLLPGVRQREEFARVGMSWEGVCFIDPDWSAQVYATLPPALREAAPVPGFTALSAPYPKLPRR